MQVYRDAAGNEYLLTPDNVANMNLEDVALPTGVTEETAPDFADLLAVYEDADGNEYLLTPDNVTNRDLTGVTLPRGVTEETAPAFAALTVFRKGDGTGARKLSRDPTGLNTLRNAIVILSSRYLSTGAVLVRTDNGSVVTERPGANCEDAAATGPAKCAFDMDSLREGTTFHLGSESATGENRVSFQTFRADREPVMFYRDVFMSQVRTIPPRNVDLREAYEDSDGNEYLLTSENITNMELTDATGLPTGITLVTAPSFADLFAVYRDDDENRYLLTPDNVVNMELTDETGLPTGVTLETAPDFASLSKVREDPPGGREEYVGYDGILQYSMFFVGVHRFFDEEDAVEPTAVRFEHASLGRIYDEDAVESGIQSPSVALTGEGVMVGMEWLSLDPDARHLVQGDVGIEYRPFEAGDSMATPPTQDVPAMVNIRIDNIQRLANDGNAWYADPAHQARLSWTDLPVTESRFSHTPMDNNPFTEDQGTLSGSFYGTEDNPEVGGVFHHEGVLYEIIGSFGSKVSPPEMEPEDPMNPMQ